MAVARLALPPVRHASPVLIASASVSSPPAIAATPGHWLEAQKWPPQAPSTLDPT